VTLAATPLLSDALARGRAALQSAAYRELPTKGPQLTPEATNIGRLGGIALGHLSGIPLGGELAGFALGPNTLRSLLGAPEIGDIRNPGPFSKIPNRAPAPNRASLGTPSADAPSAPSSSLVRPGDVAPTNGSEGRPASWDEDTVRRLAAWGDPAAIEQARLRGFGRVPLNYSESTVTNAPSLRWATATSSHSSTKANTMDQAAS
jgi:hypothetical protein